MYNVHDIANEIIKLTYEDENDDLMTNMRLQYFLYLEQGYFLAHFNKPLFNEDIKMWKYGPIIPSVFKKYAEYGYNGIKPQNISFKFENSDEYDFFLLTYNTYAIYSLKGLIQLFQTHPLFEEDNHLKTISNYQIKGRNIIIP